MTERRFCAGCLREDEENRTDLWCKECKELVCEPCARVHRRFSSPHIVVPFQQRFNRVSSIRNTPQYCEAHSKQVLTMFCKLHDQTLCQTCVSEMHDTCDQVLDIADIVSDINDRNGISDLKKRMLNLSHVMEKVMAELTDCISKIDHQRQTIKEEIMEMRTKVNMHLNKIERDILNELSNKYMEFREKTNNTISDVRIRYDNLTTLRVDGVTSLMSFEADIHSFLAFKFLDDEIRNQEKYVEAIKKETTARRIVFQPTDIEKVINEMASFGKILIVDTSKTLSSKSHQDKKPMLINSFRTTEIAENLRVFRGWFIPGRKLLMCGFNESYLYACNHDGSHSQSIAVKHQPLGVALYDRNRAIVTLGSLGFQIINLETLTAGRCIRTEADCWAICTLNEQIWVRSNVYEVSQIDISGQILRRINTIFDPRDFFLNSKGDIYSTSNYGDKLYKVTLAEEQSEFYSCPNLKLPKGVAVDNNGTVYVAGYISYNIHKISTDGQGDVLLNFEDGINQPRGMTFDRETSELMIVVNDGQNVNIYKID